MEFGDARFPFQVRFRRCLWLVVLPLSAVEPRHGVWDEFRPDVLGLSDGEEAGTDDDRLGVGSLPDEGRKFQGCGVLGVGAFPFRIGLPKALELGRHNVTLSTDSFCFLFLFLGTKS